MVDMTTIWQTPDFDHALPITWNLSPENREDLAEELWTLVQDGITDLAEYLDYFEDDLADAGASEDEAVEYFAELLARHRM